MLTIRRLLAAGLAVGVVGCTVAVPSASATTSVTSGCPYSVEYSAWGGTSTWIGDPGRIYRAPGPITLQLLVEASDSITTTVGGSSGASVDLIVASAKADVNASVAKGVASGTTVSASFSVPAGKMGWLQWGAWGYHYDWQEGTYSGACRWNVIASGTASSPSLSGKGFNHGTY